MAAAGSTDARQVAGLGSPIVMGFDSMGRSRRETVSINRRRSTVADLYIQGWRQTAIARHLGLAQSTVSTDLKAIQAEWRESSIRDFDLARQMELEKLSRVESEAWGAWERSQKPAQSAVVSTDGSQQRTQKRVEDQCGDPRFLEQVQKCIAARRALLGLDAPTRIAPVMPDGQEPFRLAVAHLSLSELRALKRLQERTLTITAEQEHEADELSEDLDARVD